MYAARSAVTKTLSLTGRPFTNKYWSIDDARLKVGFDIKPYNFISDDVDFASTCNIWLRTSGPIIAITRSNKSWSLGKRHLLLRTKPTSVRAIAKRFIVSNTDNISARSVCKNFNRAGVLPNKFETRIRVPLSQSDGFISILSTFNCKPCSMPS